MLIYHVKAGSNVILAARRVEALQEVQKACVAAHRELGIPQGGKFAVVQLDVSKTDQVAAFWDKVPQDFREVDILGAVLRAFLCGIGIP